MAERESDDFINTSTSRSDHDSPEDNRKYSHIMQNQKKMIRDDSIYLDSEASPNIPEDSTSRPATAIKTGWLEKTPPQGSIIFQKRWITLDNEYLRYFQNDKDVYSKRMIPIYSIMRVMSVGTQKFEVVTHNRTFLFRAQSDYERNTWVSLLQKTIEEQYGVDRMTSDACGPIYIQGNLELRGIHSKLYMVVCEDKVILYKNTEEHKQGIGITSIQMNLGSVRETDKRAFDLTTPYRVFSFVAETEQMKQAWVEALQHAISSALSSDSVVAKIWSQDSNRLCADCNATHPDWASVNLCVVICSRCAGEHRRLGSSVSKVRSLKMDRNVWTEDLIKVFIMLGNERANLFWAANVPPSEALCPSSSDTDRRAFIFAKYRQGKYRWYHKLFGQQEALNKALCLNVQTDDILETLSLLFCGADVNCHTEHPEFPTPVSLATRYNQTLQVEILKQNQNTDSPGVDVEDFVDANILNDLRLSITHRGHLFKMASTTRPITERKSREEFSQSLCTLKKGIFSYGNSRSSMPGRQLKVEEIVCLAINPPGTHGFEYTFEIYTEADRLYLFGENDPELVREWIMVIVKSILPRNARDLGRLDFQRIGRLNYKARLSQQSPGVGWFALVGSILHPRLPDHKEEEEDIDLCRLQELSVKQDQGKLLLIDRGRTLLIESQLKLNFLGWAQDIQQASGSWGNTLAQQQLTGTDIPIIVERCIDFITQFGLKSVGIYRKNGVSSKIANLLENFLVDARRIHLREEEHRVDDVAGTLKRFFRNVKEGVFTNQAAPAWLSTIGIKEESQRISHYQSLLSSLPSVNKATLEALIGHLYCIQHFSNVNQMNQHNLAIVFGPTLFQTDGTDSSAGKVIEELIQHYIPIFEVNEEQLQKQLHEVNLIVEIQESLMVETSPEPSSNIICTVYFEDGGQKEELHIKVDASMTAAALTSEVLEQHKIQPQEFDYWCSFEVNEVEETERPLHHRELMLPVLQSASTVVVKKNDAMETMLVYLASKLDISKYGMMKFRDERSLLSRGFQQRYVSITGTTFRIYKEVRSYRPEKECPIKSLTVFQGIKKKLRPPTSWGMTVVCDSEEQDRRQWYMCCDTQNEMREWLAIFMSIQHKGDMWPKE
ncbi:arf-GAP with Rho-GAP domain, ANK repeat and PH domain-containing protein 1-like isoform X2 [Scleropages formosus]|uniref:arf-GAP with Rho-GAP domain, ANK repeat and PH domain-containing protein 1-like isoform X2 n=1 Tax=Scleropages formosus TaxID=113540 RepID=UPI0008788FD5|nr:arf-GAP with Rho-GAP domain, ANK repeat and PH domain-containing protein 1-like isoform X2 [Scleropages formosus]